MHTQTSDGGIVLPSHVQRGTWRWLTGAPLALVLDLEGALAARHGVTVRYPFLDVRLARFVLALPPERRLPGGRMKRLLRRAMHDVLPPLVRDRGAVTRFDALVSLQARTNAARVREVLESGPWASEGYVVRSAVQTLARETRGDAHDGRFLWDVVCLEEWLRAGPGAGSGCRTSPPTSRGGPSSSPRA